MSAPIDHSALRPEQPAGDDPMTPEERATLATLLATVADHTKQIAALLARQRRQEDVGAEHHEAIRTIMAAVEATSAAVTVLMHDKYEGGAPP